VTNWNITCPKCKKEFNLDLPKKEKKHEVVCPSCDNKFTIKTDHSTTKSKDEFVWIEHGEPRKTILSSIKPRTNRPMIAAILLTCVFIIGITTAVFIDFLIPIMSYVGSFMDFLKDNLNIGYPIIIVIFSVFALPAVFACIKRKHFNLAFFSSFITIFSFGFFFIGSILSIIAFVLIFVSRDEFEDEKKGKIF